MYRVLELAGLSDRIDKNAPAIMQTIKHVAWNTGTTTYRTIIDNLLSDYGWVMLIRGDTITFAQTAVSQMEIVDEIQPEDIVGHISKDKTYIVANGVSVSWPKTKIMDDALLWRGNLPIGDTANPRPGEPIAQGDYWPEDSDIIETWMDYGTDYLDVDWLEGKNPFIKTISTWYDNARGLTKYIQYKGKEIVWILNNEYFWCDLDHFASGQPGINIPMRTDWLLVALHGVICGETAENFSVPIPNNIGRILGIIAFVGRRRVNHIRQIFNTGIQQCYIVCIKDRGAYTWQYRVVFCTCGQQTQTHSNDDNFSHLIHPLDSS